MKEPGKHFQKLLKFICVLLIVAFCFSCSQTDKTRKTNRYDLLFYTELNGVKPQVGEHVFFQMDILDDQKKVLQTYRNQKQMPSLKIPPKDSKSMVQNPIPAALIQMVVNDSVGIIIPRDSIPDLEAEYDHIEYLEYVVVLKEILTEQEFQQKLKLQKEADRASSAATRMRLPEVEALAQKTLSEFKSGKLATKYTENGVGYYIHAKGDGDIPTKDRLIHAQYFGLLQSNGYSFDNSFKGGRAYAFRVGRGAVIKGWDEAFMYLPVGTKASLFIPSEFGYGETGSPPDIAPGADLYFYVELEEMYY